MVFKRSLSKTDAMKALVFVILLPCSVLAYIPLIRNSTEDARVTLLVDLIILNLKNNGWNSIITYGHLPDSFYNKIKLLPCAFITLYTGEDDNYIEDSVPYHSSTVLIDCVNFTEFEESFRHVINLPYWHPLANVIILYRKHEGKQEVARIFFILWYYKASNAILVQYDDNEQLILIHQYNPFVVDDASDIFGCRTVRPIGMPIYKFEEAFVCEENCHNVSIKSKHRHVRLGTCIGLQTHTIHYDDRNELTKLTLFEDRGRNMNGFTLRAFSNEVPPFTIINDLGNGTYELDSRDGIIWNNLAELMNFTIDLTPSADVIKKFNFEVSIQNIFSVAHRKGDLFLVPIYQFDIIVVEVDYTIAFKDSGLCFVTHRALFETILFDFKNLQENFVIVIEFLASVICIWLVFFLYSALDTEIITVDLIGKNFMNTIRSALSITLYKPPKRQSFRIFLAIILWSFFVLNFSTQAAIISFFTAFKRGKEIETFNDIAEKGYKIQGLASPDAVLPDDNEVFRKINSKLEPVSDMFSCAMAITNDSHRFCLIDCSVGRYLARNLLNEKGEQYLHIAKDRVHNYYLNFVFSKHSVLTDSVNKYLMIFYEAGLVKKWEQYRFNHIKEEVPIKPLGMEEFKGIFNVYFGAVLLTCLIFLVELLVGNYKGIKKKCTLKVKNWNSSRIERKILKLKRKKDKITSVSNSTQT